MHGPLLNTDLSSPDRFLFAAFKPNDDLPGDDNPKVTALGAMHRHAVLGWDIGGPEPDALWRAAWQLLLELRLRCRVGDGNLCAGGEAGEPAFLGPEGVEGRDLFVGREKGGSFVVDTGNDKARCWELLGMHDV